jgi:IS605 OrfB family transposase
MFVTYNFNIKSIDNVQVFDTTVFNYTGLFQKLYNNFELSGDKQTIVDYCNKFNVSRSLFDNCVTDAKMSLESLIEIKKDKELKITEVQKELDKLNKLERLSKRQKIFRIKLETKLVNLKKSLDKDVTFGGKELLRKITKLSQNTDKTDKQVKLLEKYKQQFTENRKRNIFFHGRANEGGNRYIDFHLTEGYLIFKFDRNTHIKFNFKLPYKSNKRMKMLQELQFLVNSNQIALTVRLSKTQICLSFDNEIVNGYQFDTKLLNELKKKFPLTDNKTHYKTVKQEQFNRKSRGKILNRCAGVDLNPSEIGFSIVDVNSQTNEIERVIFKRKYNLSFYTDKSNIKGKKKSTQQKIRDKYKNELSSIYDDIINYCIHYKVCYFGLEELLNISQYNTEKATEFNRQVKNVWNRSLQVNLLKTRCDTFGIMLEEVDPKYTSVIGNLLYATNYGLHDCVGSSIEVARRSYTKYLSDCPNRLYPTLANYNSESLTERTGVAVPSKESWILISKEIKKPSYGAGGWWRLKPSTVGKYLNSETSMITYH